MTAQETADGLMDSDAASYSVPDDWRDLPAFTDLRDAILAALLAERQAALAGVRVKPLVWGASGEAKTPFGVYSVDFDHDEEMERSPWSAWSPNEGLGNFPTYEAAKAAAHADYESRIMSALALSPEGKGPIDHTPEEET